MKICTACKVEKNSTEFSPNKRGSLGLHSYCKPCASMKVLESRKKNKENFEKYQKEYRLQSKYGLSVEDYNQLLHNQDGKCKTCGTTTPGGRGNFPVDHSHVTGEVRGLLCNSCNVLLAMANDSTTTLSSAIKYLENFKEK